MRLFLNFCFIVPIALTGCNESDGNNTSSIQVRQQITLSEKASSCGNKLPLENLALSCDTSKTADGLEPPCNPHLAQNAWSASHRNNFAQASSPLPGVLGNKPVQVEHQTTLSIPIVLNFSEPDSQDRQALWASTISRIGQVFKLDAATLRPIQSLALGGTGSGASGAYNMLDRDQRLIVGQADRLRVFGDAETGNRHSLIAELKNYQLPASSKCREDDQLVGITMLPDGHVAYATRYGQVGVIPRFPEAMCDASLRTFSINSEKCSDTNIPASQLEDVSNSIAADENGNIFVVTSGAQYRIDWDGQKLKLGWRAEYAGAGGSGAGRLGGGSGSTPTLMGTRADDDKFVVITDGQPLMHLVLLWRDNIPRDWRPVKPGRDRRIACEIPVDFGDSSRTESLSEQSVLVRGYSSVVVNNQLALNKFLAPLPGDSQPLVSQLSSGLSLNKPKGLQRIDWDPKTRSCKTIWTNSEISLPNGIPTMSAASQQIFGIGSRTLNGIDTWTLESVDFVTGRENFSVPAGILPTENSFYAATTIGPDNSVWTGTFGGVTRYRNIKENR